MVRVIAAPVRSSAPLRALLGLLVAAVLGAFVVAGSASAATPSGHTRGTKAHRAEPVEVAFVGRVTAAESYEADESRPGREQGLRYTVDVVSIFGQAPIEVAPKGESTLVDVLAPEVFEGFPRDRATQRYLFRVTRIGTSDNFQARRKLSIAEYDRTADDSLETLYGAKQTLNALGPGPVVPDPQKISFLCPDTGEVLPDPSDPAVDCEGLPGPTSTDRAAAPGAALVLVGFLGLFVIRRLGGRGRRPRY